jgi:hypothetical protein
VQRPNAFSLRSDELNRITPHTHNPMNVNLQLNQIRGRTPEQFVIGDIAVHNDEIVRVIVESKLHSSGLSCFSTVNSIR